MSHAGIESINKLYINKYIQAKKARKAYMDKKEKVMEKIKLHNSSTRLIVSLSLGKLANHF